MKLLYIDFFISGVIVLSTLLGLITGGFISLTFFRLEKIWERFIVSFLIGSSPLPGIYLIFRYFKLSEVVQVWCFVLFFAAMIMSFLFTLINLLKRLKKLEGESFVIRDVDILLGYKNVITNYYELRKNEADVSIKKLQKEKEDINKLEYKINVQRELINEKERNINASVESAITVKFPMNKHFPLSRAFINSIPANTRRFQRFAFYSSILANDIGNSYRSFLEKNPDPYGEVAALRLRDFAKGLCDYATSCIFSPEVRTHVRYLHRGEIYKGLVTSFDKTDHTNKITDIPLKEVNLISYSKKARCSLLRNFNPEHDYNVSGPRWYNYLTLALTDHVFLNENDDPILSMGISITEIAHYEELIRFLNFIQFEHIVEQTFLQFNRFVNCKLAVKYLSTHTLK